LTGRLLSEKEVRALTSHVVGKYFAEWFPEPEAERSARERVEEARLHIGKASQIIAEMQIDLSHQTERLDQVLSEIEEKKELSERYQRLAETNQEQFAAFRGELEGAVRQELVAQSEQGKGLRRLASVLIWLLTLVAGAALGAYFREIVAWMQGIIV